MTLSSGGVLAIDTEGTDAINFGIEAVAKTITIGNDASAKVGVNALIIELDSAGTILLDAVGVLELNSSAGVIGIGNDAVAQAINIGTGDAVRPITIGNATGATAVNITTGTGGLGITLGSDANGDMYYLNGDGKLTRIPVGSDNHVLTLDGSVPGWEAASGGTASDITVTAHNSDDETVYLTFVDGAAGTQGIETHAVLTYNPSSGILTTSSVTGNLTGNASTATKIASITNSNIVQLVETQTLTNKTLTSPTITGTGAIAGTFSGNITGNVNGDVTGDVTGNASTATKIASITNSNIVQLVETQTLTNKTLTSPTITGTGAIAGTFSGNITGNVNGDVTGDVTGNASTATKIASITNSNIVQLVETQTLTNKTLTSPTITGTGAIAGTFSGNITGNVNGDVTGDVTGNCSGTALTVTQAAQSAITSVGTLTALTVGGDLNVTGDTTTFSSANSNDPLVIIKNTTDDVNGARLQFVKDKGSAGADGDDIGSIEFVGDDAAQAQTTFAKILAEVSEADNTDEAGKLSFFVAESNGTSTQLTAGLIIEGEHATDGEVDVTIGAGTSSTTTIAGKLNANGNIYSSNTSLKGNGLYVDPTYYRNIIGGEIITTILIDIDGLDVHTDQSGSFDKRFTLGNQHDGSNTNNSYLLEIDSAVMGSIFEFELICIEEPKRLNDGAPIRINIGLGVSSSGAPTSGSEVADSNTIIDNTNWTSNMGKRSYTIGSSGNESRISVDDKYLILLNQNIQTSDNDEITQGKFMIKMRGVTI